MSPKKINLNFLHKTWKNKFVRVKKIVNISKISNVIFLITVFINKENKDKFGMKIKLLINI